MDTLLQTKDKIHDTGSKTSLYLYCDTTVWDLRDNLLGYQRVLTSRLPRTAVSFHIRVQKEPPVSLKFKMQFSSARRCTQCVSCAPTSWTAWERHCVYHERTEPRGVRALAWAYDWCCFYYSIKNSLVALTKARFARTFFLDLRCADIFYVLGLSSAPPNSIQAPVPGCRHSSCLLIIHVCLCLCASTCACENE